LTALVDSPMVGFALCGKETSMGRPSIYPVEFRREAIELMNTSGRPGVEIARSLGVSDTALANWVRVDREALERAAGPDGLSESELAELKRLRKENLELRTDREILWKAAAFFAREMNR
jgi:transposase